LPDKTTSEPNTTNPLLHFHYAGLTHIGQLRNHNEDAYKLPGNIEKDTLQKKGYFYVLADGMGGHHKGEVASAVTIETTNAHYYAHVASLEGSEPEEIIIQAMTTAIEQANQRVMETTEGGGTTIVAATMYNDKLVIMNIGDSRAYLLREGNLEMISRDHSLVYRLREMGKISEEEALNHPRQNVLYQALGQGPELEIHVHTDRLQLGDVLLLCSDGLWGPVGDAAIYEVLATTPSPLKATKTLIDMANAAGGPDNITAIMVRVLDEEPPEEDLSDEIAQFPPDASDTQPLPFARNKPATLPEGKYFRDNNGAGDD
jgi:protein phosphatase